MFIFYIWSSCVFLFCFVSSNVFGYFLFCSCVFCPNILLLFHFSFKAEVLYDADEDTVSTAESSPEQINTDPYQFDFVDDDNVQSKPKRQYTKAKSQKHSKKNKRIKKGSIMLHTNSTSTPVLSGQSSDSCNSKTDKCRNAKDFLITPEVTPILPIPPDSASDGCKSTPTVRRSLRKRSLHLGEKQLSSMTSSLNSLASQSQGDSGIVMSPPAKKLKGDSFQFTSKPLHLDKPPYISKAEKDWPSTSFSLETNKSDVALKNQGKRKVLIQKSENSVLKRAKIDTPGSSLNSQSSPLFSDENDIRKVQTKAKKSVKVKVASKQSYRSKKSSSTDSPKKTHQNLDQENNRCFTRSPTLFSDSLFSDDTGKNFFVIITILFIFV